MKEFWSNLNARFNAQATSIFSPAAKMTSDCYELSRLEQVHDSEGELQRENTITTTKWYEARKQKSGDYKIFACTKTSPKNGILIVEPYAENSVHLKGGKDEFDGYTATKLLSELEYKLSKTPKWSKAKTQPLAPLSFRREKLSF
jgi:hypothetical protein